MSEQYQKFIYEEGGSTDDRDKDLELALDTLIGKKIGDIYTSCETNDFIGFGPEIGKKNERFIVVLAEDRWEIWREN